MMIDLILHRLASLVSNTESKLAIVPEYPIATTEMDEGPLLSGIVDYLLIRCPAYFSGYRL